MSSCGYSYNAFVTYLRDFTSVFSVTLHLSHVESQACLNRKTLAKMRMAASTSTRILALMTIVSQKKKVYMEP